MIPDECASMRSMARWVFPVFVGPSTAVTPVPRAPETRLLAEEKEIGIKNWKLGGVFPAAPSRCVPQCDAQSVVAGLCLSFGTSLERIAAESLTSRLSEFVHGYISAWQRIHILSVVLPRRQAPRNG